MFSLYTITTVLFCHWFFDFFLQTPEMANGKSKSNKNDSYYTDRVMWNDLDKMWWPHSPLTWMIDSTEVIGTLFENPELLLTNHQ